MIQQGLRNVTSHRLPNLAVKLRNEEYRHSYLEHRIKASLACQIRALRGNRTQEEFGREIGMPQSVVSRLEDEEYGNTNLNTLIGIAQKLDIALLVQFTDYPTFLLFTDDQSDGAMAPPPFRASAVDALANTRDDDLSVGGAMQARQKTGDVESAACNSHLGNFPSRSGEGAPSPNDSRAAYG